MGRVHIGSQKPSVVCHEQTDTPTQTKSCQDMLYCTHTHLSGCVHACVLACLHAIILIAPFTFITFKSFQLLIQGFHFKQAHTRKTWRLLELNWIPSGKYNLDSFGSDTHLLCTCAAPNSISEYHHCPTMLSVHLKRTDYCFTCVLQASTQVLLSNCWWVCWWHSGDI